MRSRVTLLLLCQSLFLPLDSTVAQGQVSGAWQLIESTSFDWNGNGLPETFEVYGAMFDSDKDNLHHLRILEGDSLRLAVYDQGGFTTLKIGLYGERRQERLGPNLLESNYLLVPQNGPTYHDRPLLLLFGFPYASSPGSLRILGIDVADRPAELGYLEVFDLCDFQDLDGDGQPELCGFEDGSESFGLSDGRLAFTYEPKAVFRLHEGPPPTLRADKVLTKRINLEQGFGWVEDPRKVACVFDSVSAILLDIETLDTLSVRSLSGAGTAGSPDDPQTDR